MAVNQTIGKFIEVASKRDFARDNLFRIMYLSCRNLTLSEDDLVYAKGGKLPARETPVGDNVKYMGMTMPYTKSTVSYPGNTDYEIEFYLDANSEIAHKFERASRTAFNDMTSTGDWRFPSLSDEMTVAVLDINLDPIEYITFQGLSFVKFDEVDFKVADSTGEAIMIKAHVSFINYVREGSNTVFAGV